MPLYIYISQKAMSKFASTLVVLSGSIYLFGNSYNSLADTVVSKNEQTKENVDSTKSSVCSVLMVMRMKMTFVAIVLFMFHNQETQLSGKYS